MWRMQSAQDQPPALTVVRSLGATNGKEEEADAGEEAALAAVSVESNLFDVRGGGGPVNQTGNPEVKGRCH